MDTPQLPSILIVEDTDDLRALICRGFKRGGFAVTEAEGGKRAFELVTNVSFDVVVSDIQMPTGNGVDLLKNIRSARPHLPVYLITGDSTFVKKTAIDLGAEEVFLKPISVASLLATVQARLARKMEDVVPTVLVKSLV